MSFISTTRPDAAQGAVADMYRRQQASWGHVPNYAKVFSHRPEVLARWGQLLAEIRRPMDKRRFELVTFAAAHELGNSPCVLAHGRALLEFFDAGQVAALAQDRLHDVLDPAEQALVDFARQVAADASRVDADHIDTLRQHDFSDAEIFDVAAAVAGRAFFTKLLDALGVQADSVSLAMDRRLRAALAVGRPIDSTPVVRMPAETHPAEDHHDR